MSADERHQEDNDERAGGLGEDPFEGADLQWLDRDQGELSLEVLGHDPFEGLDIDWLDEPEEESVVLLSEEDSPSPAQPEPALAQEFEVEHEPSIEPPAFPELAEPIVPVPSLISEDVEAPRHSAPARDVETAPYGGMGDVFLEPELAVEPGCAVASGLPTETEEVFQPAPTPEATFHFPADFAWGVAVSAHQVEGNCTNNDWWAWEQEVGRIEHSQRSGAACDWWQNAERDFDLAADMGVRALRLSVEWSRIESRLGTFDDAALRRYAQMLRGLRARRIEPMVTLHHVTNPAWLAEQGGWENPETVKLFARYVRRTVETLANQCDLWCTIQEPNVYGYLSYVAGLHPPGRTDLKAARRVIRHMLLAHAAAYREIHTVQRDARVGLAHHMRPMDPANARSVLDRRLAHWADQAFNQAILTALTKGRWTPPLGFGLAWGLRRTLDWIGLNYYTRELITYDRTQQPYSMGRVRSDQAELFDGGCGEFYPEGIFRSIRRLAELGLPIYITENGFPDDDDDQRPRFMLSHLHQVWRAIQLSYPVMGYYHGSLVDRFQWSRGWTLRYGLFAVDQKTQKRTPRRSAGLYRSIAQDNAITPQILDTYAPRLRPRLLPGRVIEP